MGSLDGQVAVVTGANRGLGAEIAIRFAAAGADLAVSARDRSSLADTTAAVAAHGRRVIALECDVTRPRSADAMARDALEHYGHVDTVVANAGVAARRSQCMRSNSMPGASVSAPTWTASS